MAIPESHHDLQFHGSPVYPGSLDEIRVIYRALSERVSVAG